MYCVVLIGYIFIFNIGFNLLLTFLGRTSLHAALHSVAHVHIVCCSLCWLLLWGSGMHNTHEELLAVHFMASRSRVLHKQSHRPTMYDA